MNEDLHQIEIDQQEIDALRAQNAELVAALKLARIPFAASLPRRFDRDEAERELAQIDAALAAAGQGSGK